MLLLIIIAILFVSITTYYIYYKINLIDKNKSNISNDVPVTTVNPVTLTPSNVDITLPVNNIDYVIGLYGYIYRDNNLYKVQDGLSPTKLEDKNWTTYEKPMLDLKNKFSSYIIVPNYFKLKYKDTNKILSTDVNNLEQGTDFYLVGEFNYQKIRNPSTMMLVDEIVYPFMNFYLKDLLTNKFVNILNDNSILLSTDTKELLSFDTQNQTIILNNKEIYIVYDNINISTPFPSTLIYTVTSTPESTVTSTPESAVTSTPESTVTSTPESTKTLVFPYKNIIENLTYNNEPIYSTSTIYYNSFVILSEDNNDVYFNSSFNIYRWNSLTNAISLISNNNIIENLDYGIDLLELKYFNNKNNNNILARNLVGLYILKLNSDNTLNNEWILLKSDVTRFDIIDNNIYVLVRDGYDNRGRFQYTLKKLSLDTDNNITSEINILTMSYDAPFKVVIHTNKLYLYYFDNSYYIRVYDLSNNDFTNNFRDIIISSYVSVNVKNINVSYKGNIYLGGQFVKKYPIDIDNNIYTYPSFYLVYLDINTESWFELLTSSNANITSIVPAKNNIVYFGGDFNKVFINPYKTETINSNYIAAWDETKDNPFQRNWITFGNKLSKLTSPAIHNMQLTNDEKFMLISGNSIVRYVDNGINKENKYKQLNILNVETNEFEKTV